MGFRLKYAIKINDYAIPLICLIFILLMNKHDSDEQEGIC